MRDTEHSGQRGVVSLATVGMGPRTATLLGASAITTSAYLMGSEWLGQAWLGLPMGAWASAAVAGIVHFAVTRWASVWSPDLCAALRSSRAGPSTRAGLRCWASADNMAATVLELLGVPARSVEAAHTRIRQTAAALTGDRPGLRIGVDLGESDYQSLAANAPVQLTPGVNVEWVRVRAGLAVDAQRDLRGLDALIRRESAGDRRPVAFLPERSDRPAAWFDWSWPTPLSFASVFPTRIDPDRVTLDCSDLADAGDAQFASELVVAAAVLARSPARLGRSFMPSVMSPAERHELAGMVMLRLAARLDEDSRSDSIRSHGLRRSAARAVSAWLTNSDNSTSFNLSPEGRCSLVAAADLFIRGEPESALRLAAAEIASHQDEAGMETLLRARTLLQSRFDLGTIDPLAFVLSEIEHGVAGTLALGRVASGICLLWALTPQRAHAYLRDDIGDDLRHAGWLNGREQDHRTLLAVMDRLDTLEMPAIREAA